MTNGDAERSFVIFLFGIRQPQVVRAAEGGADARCAAACAGSEGHCNACAAQRPAHRRARDHSLNSNGSVGKGFSAGLSSASNTVARLPSRLISQVPITLAAISSRIVHQGPITWPTWIRT